MGSHESGLFAHTLTTLGPEQAGSTLWGLLCREGFYPGVLSLGVFFLIVEVGDKCHNNIAKTQGFLAEHCIETRQSVSFTLPVCSFNAVADQCAVKSVLFVFLVNLIGSICLLSVIKNDNNNKC